jgi:Mitochondrial inner membrane protein
MMRHVFSRGRASARSVGSRSSRQAHEPETLESGVPRTLATLVVLPTTALAAGMHFIPDFRAMVEEQLPGSTDTLSKVTGTDYARVDPDREWSTLPDNYEKLPDLMDRIAREKNASPDLEPRVVKEEKRSDAKVEVRGGDKEVSFLARAKAAAVAGEKEHSASGPRIVESIKDTARTAAAAAKAQGDKGPDVAPPSTGNGWLSPAAWLGRESAPNRDSPPAVDVATRVRKGALSASENNSSVASDASEAAKCAAHEACDALSSASHKASAASHDVAGLDFDAAHGASDAFSSAASDMKESVKPATHEAGESFSSAANKAKLSARSGGDRTADAIHAASNAISSAASDAKKVAKVAAHDAVDLVPSASHKATSAAASGAADKSLDSAFPMTGKADSGSAGYEKTADSDNSGGHLARLLGRGDFEPSAVEGKDVVDVAVYMRPPWSSRSASSNERSGAGTISPPGASCASPEGGFSSVTSDSKSKFDPVVDALQAELKSQAKWDAVRLQEAVRAQSVAEKKTAAAELAEQAKKHKLELQKAKETAAVDAQKMVDEKTRELEAEMIRRRDAEVARLMKEREDVIKATLEAAYFERERSAAAEREMELMKLKASVDALNDDLDRSYEDRKASQAASMRNAAAFSLRDALQGTGSVDAELAKVSQLSELGKLVASSIPAEVKQRGLPTANELKSSFDAVSREGRKAALVPEGDVGTIWGHMLASVVSRLKVAVDAGNTPYVPFTNEERIRLAEKHVAVGDLEMAVDVLEEVRGLAADAISDWVDAAKARIAADVGTQALLAESLVTQQAYASSSAFVQSEQSGSSECYF